MGFEYRIIFKRPSVEQLNTDLCTLQCFRNFDEKFGLYYLSLDPNLSQTEWPDANVAIEENGLYFCDNGTQGGKDVLEIVLDLARKYDPNVEYDEL